MLKGINQIKPYIKGGIKEIGLPSLDPLVIPEISLEQGTPSLNYKVNMKNVTIYGIDDYQFKAVS